MGKEWAGCGGRRRVEFSASPNVLFSGLHPYLGVEGLGAVVLFDEAQDGHSVAAYVRVRRLECGLREQLQLAELKLCENRVRETATSSQRRSSSIQSRTPHTCTPGRTMGMRSPG